MKRENTKLTCPDCAGALEKIENENLLQYRCRVGHLYSPESAIAAHACKEEVLLWSAVAVLEEAADLAEEVAAWPTTKKPDELRTQATGKRKLAERVRQIVLELPNATPVAE